MKITLYAASDPNAPQVDSKWGGQRITFRVRWTLELDYAADGWIVELLKAAVDWKQRSYSHASKIWSFEQIGALPILARVIDRSGYWNGRVILAGSMTAWNTVVNDMPAEWRGRVWLGDQCVIDLSRMYVSWQSPTKPRSAPEPSSQPQAKPQRRQLVGTVRYDVAERKLVVLMGDAPFVLACDPHTWQIALDAATKTDKIRIDDPYVLLERFAKDRGVWQRRAPGADDIRAAYRAAARAWHPDTTALSDKGVAVELFRVATDAYDLLNNPLRRRLFDSMGAKFAQERYITVSSPFDHAHTSATVEAKGNTAIRITFHTGAK